MLFSMWFWLFFMASWFWLLKLFDFMISEKTPSSAYAVAFRVNWASAMFGLGASYIHGCRFMNREISNHNMRDDVSYTFKLESKMLDNSVYNERVDDTIPDCVLNAYAVSCHQRVFN